MEAALTRPHEGPKARPPEPFDGEDPDKLDNFITQLTLYFGRYQDGFRDDADRVATALTYLKGDAYAYFGDKIAAARARGDARVPDWFQSFRAWKDELIRVFGPKDPIKDATRKLKALKMTGRAYQYNLAFNQLAAKINWNEEPLRDQYYNGLLDRIKNELSKRENPATLADLQVEVFKIDERYLDRQEEIKKEQAALRTTNRGSNPAPHPRNNHSSGGPGPSSSSSTPHHSAPSHLRNNHSRHQHSPNNFRRPQERQPSAPHASTSAPSASSANSSGGGNRNNRQGGGQQRPWNNNLDANGRLRPEERERRMRNNLCLVCAASGHRAADCPRTRRARRANASAPQVSDSSQSGNH